MTTSEEYVSEVARLFQEYCRNFSLKSVPYSQMDKENSHIGLTISASNVILPHSIRDRRKGPVRETKIEWGVYKRFKRPQRIYRPVDIETANYELLSFTAEFYYSQGQINSPSTSHRSERSVYLVSSFPDLEEVKRVEKPSGVEEKSERSIIEVIAEILRERPF